MKSLPVFLKKFVRKFTYRNFFLFVLSFYQIVFSVHFGGACRFLPSCSLYAKQALLTYSVKKALFLIIKRVSRCHFWGGYGIDSIPTSRINDFSSKK